MAGATGVEVVSVSLFAAGSTIRGGSGGDGVPTLSGFCSGRSSCGTGLVADGVVTLLDSTIAGGAAGTAIPTCPPTGVDGVATVVTTGVIHAFAEPARSLSITSPLCEGVPGTIAVRRLPGEPAFLLRSFAPAGTFVLALRGALICQPPLCITALGSLPGNGELTLSATIPVGTLPAGIDVVEVYEQVAVPGLAGTGVLSAPTAVAIVR